MKKQYQDWIDDYLKRVKYPLGKCRSACEEMLKAFPELHEVRGHVYCAWGKRGHIWLETDAGEKVDPTVSQFSSAVEYESWKPGDAVCVGKCMNCGDEIWREVDNLSEDHSYYGLCSPECEIEMAESLR